MNMEDRLRGGLRWQAEQIDAYDVEIERVQARGIQRRRRAQGLTAGGALAAAALLVAGGLLFDFRAQQASETLYADDVDNALTVPTPAVEEPALVADMEPEIDKPADVSIALDALPDLIGVEGVTIVSRRSDGTASELAPSAPLDTSNNSRSARDRVVVQDGVSGFVQFGENDIMWTPSAAADAILVVKITRTGAELGYTSQRLVFGDVFVNEAGNPTVLYGEERTRGDRIEVQRIVIRDLLTGERTTLADWQASEDEDGLSAMSQVSLGGGLVAVVRSQPCAVEILDLAGVSQDEFGLVDCAADSYGSIAPDGATVALVAFRNRRDIAVSVYSLADGSESSTFATEDMEIRPVDHPIDYDGRFIVASRSDVTIVFDTEDESVHTLGFTGPSTVSSVSSIVAGSSSLRAADVEEPFVPSCPRQSGAILTLRPGSDDGPRPRCVRADSGQRLVFENDGTEPWKVKFAHIDVEIEPGEVYTDAFALGTYLAPGVHRISPESAGVEGPGGTELWFDPAGRYQIALRTFGPIELGDAFDSANTAIGGVLDSDASGEALSVGCATTLVGRELDPTLMVVGGLDPTGEPTGEAIIAAAAVTRPGVTTLSGIGVGSSVREVVAAYRNRIEIEDSTTFEGGIDLIFTPQSEEDENFRIVFVADDTQVLSYRSGLLPYVLLADGCEGYLAAEEAGDS